MINGFKIDRNKGVVEAWIDAPYQLSLYNDWQHCYIQTPSVVKAKARALWSVINSSNRVKKKGDYWQQRYREISGDEWDKRRFIFTKQVYRDAIAKYG